jgi:hypothetical protein
LLSALTERLRRFLDEDEADAVLDEHASEQARHLAGMVANAEASAQLDIGGLAVLCLLNWHHFCALPKATGWLIWPQRAHFEASGGAYQDSVPVQKS